MDYKKNIVGRFYLSCNNCKDYIFQGFRDSSGKKIFIYYRDAFSIIAKIGIGLKTIGVKQGDKISVFLDNKPEWMHLNLAINGLRAIDVPRGNDTPLDELNFISRHSDSEFIVFENAKILKKFLEKTDRKIRGYIIISDDKGDLKNKNLWTYSEILELGEKNSNYEKDFLQEVEKGKEDDINCIIYTSGTTGEPKGVMLTNRNFTFQLDRIHKGFIPIKAGENKLCALPVWHVFERTCNFILVNTGSGLIYSKPIGAVMMKDLSEFNPEWFTSVPRIWESIYKAIQKNINSSSTIKKFVFHFFLHVGTVYKTSLHKVCGKYLTYKKPNRLADILLNLPIVILSYAFYFLGDILVFKNIRKKMGKRMIGCVSGGGALPDYIDKFFDVVGIVLLEGYGLTETAPVISVRKFSSPILGGIGPVLPDVEYKIVDGDGNRVQMGEKGELIIRSPQVMKGYYKNEKKTKEVLSEDGWFKTGDLALESYQKNIKLVGRKKDTIVLSGGENIEPKNIEDKLLESEYIDQVMLFGQDKKFLGLVVVPAFNVLDEFARIRNIKYQNYSELIENEKIINLYEKEIQGLINSENGFRPFEKIGGFFLLDRNFKIGDEITETLKIKRDVVAEIFKKEIEQIYN